MKDPTAALAIGADRIARTKAATPAVHTAIHYFKPGREAGHVVLTWPEFSDPIEKIGERPRVYVAR